MQGRVARMGGLEASDPLQFIPPPTLTLRVGDFLLDIIEEIVDIEDVLQFENNANT